MSKRDSLDTTRGLQSPVLPRSDVSLDLVVKRLEESGRDFDAKRLGAVHDFIVERHGDQKRASGEPYTTHLVYVGYLLAEQRFDAATVEAGLLHDIIEDTDTTFDELVEAFGKSTADLVEAVTKIGRHEYIRRDEAQAETFRKLILASVDDVRAIVIKLADRLHNMLTLEHLDADRRRRIGRETLEIYAPLAHRLGMWRVQGDLEDLAFYHLYPHQFRRLRNSLEERIKEAKRTNRDIHKQLEGALTKAGIKCEINSRLKRYYSIYLKLRQRGIPLDRLYDYLAFRVITGDTKDCYAALGVVHQRWRPVPGRFKDYIAMPKPNLYQSLHTTMVSDRGAPFEVQIRTSEMDRIAEDGIAAHWRYKGGPGDGEDEGRAIGWLRQLLEWQQGVNDPQSFLASLKVDLFPDEVYVFTPKGDVLAFPRGATPLDFAYRVHTDVGHHCSGARINGKLVPLRTELCNGDQVEILTDAARTPSRDWLELTATSRARTKIRHWLNARQKERATEVGRRVLEKELRRSSTSLKRFLAHEDLAPYLSANGISKPDDLLSEIGFGKIAARTVVEKVLQHPEEPGIAHEMGRTLRRWLPGGERPVVVKGHGDLLVYLAKCCNPLPGDAIIGYVTRGRGVSVHRTDCPNVGKLLFDPGREIEVAWGRGGETYPVVVDIETVDESGMLARLTDEIARRGRDIRQITADTKEEGRGRIAVVLEVANRADLDRLCDGLLSLPGVLGVERRMGTPGE